MLCQECRAELSSLMDGELSLTRIREVWKHLQTCASCARECAQMCCTDAVVMQTCCVLEEVVLPAVEPEIRLSPTESPELSIACRELRWWFTVPEPGARRRWGFYEYPERCLGGINELEATGTAHVYGRPCTELRYRTYSPTGELHREAYAYGTVADGEVQWLGWWNLSDNHKFYTWRDEGFREDWGGSSVQIAAQKQIASDSANDVQRVGRNSASSSGDASGAEFWQVRIGETEHLCLRVIEIDGEGEETLCEVFIDTDGRSVLFRRYLHADTMLGDHSVHDVLAGSLRLVHDGATYYLWYDCVPEDMLA